VSKDYRLLCGIAVGYPSDAPVNSFEAHRIGLDELLVKTKQKKN
ncbi:MAG: nitroreductase, partial [Actinobacteria bacterium]|nr:nitroreductase [Actinomycetota bacterium]